MEGYLFIFHPDRTAAWREGALPGPEAVLFGHRAIAAEPWSNCSASFAALPVTFAGER